MLEKLEALRALQATGTMGQAAARLRITQSAVSKRIAALEDEVGVALIEPAGRRVRITPEGERLLCEAEPLLARLQDVLHAHVPAEREVLRVAASESLLCGWLPAALRDAVDRSGARIELHAHRGPILLERVRSGDYALGLCADPGTEADLVATRLGDEPMAIVPSGPLPSSGDVPIWTIEPRSLTWEAIERRLARQPLVVVGRLESFSALVQIARAGFGHALVPVGVAQALGAEVVRVDVARPVAVFARQTALQRPAVRALHDALVAVAPAALAAL